MTHLLNAMEHLIQTDTKICSNLSGPKDETKDLAERMKASAKLLKDARDAKAVDSVGRWVVILHATTVIYAVTLHTSKYNGLSWFLSISLSWSVGLFIQEEAIMRTFLNRSFNWE